MISLADVVGEVSALLVARRVPLAVVKGPQRSDPQLTLSNSVEFRTREGADGVEVPARRGGNPSPVALLTSGCTAIVRGRSTTVGATIWDHQGIVALFAHAVISALVQAAGKLQLPIGFGSCGWVDNPQQEVDYGARYEIEFTLPESVFAETWDSASGVEWGGTCVAVINDEEFEAC